MSLRMRRLSTILPILPLTAVVGLGADVPKSADHPLIQRYEGSTIVRYSQKESDEYTLPVGPAEGRGNDVRFPKALMLEGRVTRITYLIPVGRSVLEVVRNYDLELKKAGYTTLFAGTQDALGAKGNTFARGRYRDLAVPSFSGTNFSMLASADERYLAAKLARPEGDVHVALYATAIGDGWGKFLYLRSSEQEQNGGRRPGHRPTRHRRGEGDADQHGGRLGWRDGDGHRHDRERRSLRNPLRLQQRRGQGRIDADPRGNRQAAER